MIAKCWPVTEAMLQCSALPARESQIDVGPASDWRGRPEPETQLGCGEHQ